MQVYSIPPFWIPMVHLQCLNLSEKCQVIRWQTTTFVTLHYRNVKFANFSFISVTIVQGPPSGNAVASLWDRNYVKIRQDWQTSTQTHTHTTRKHTHTPHTKTHTTNTHTAHTAHSTHTHTHNKHTSKLLLLSTANLASSPSFFVTFCNIKGPISRLNYEN